MAKSKCSACSRFSSYHSPGSRAIGIVPAAPRERPPQVRDATAIGRPFRERLSEELAQFWRRPVLGEVINACPRHVAELPPVLRPVGTFADAATHRDEFVALCGGADRGDLRPQLPLPAWPPHTPPSQVGHAPSP